MKKFFFRLETLLKLRHSRERLMQRELAYQNQKLSQLIEKKEMLESHITSLIDEIRKKRDVHDRSLQETYSQILDHLNISLTSEKETIFSQEKVVEELKCRLQRIVHERKVIEKIKEKHYSHWRMQQEQSEGAILDEVTSRSE